MPKRKLEDEEIELPKKPQVGDLVRLKEERRPDYREACKKAGWDFDASMSFTVLRADDFGPGNTRRLFIAGPPFALGGSDVELAWRNEGERREFLRSKGWRV